MLPKFVEEGTLVYCWWACKADTATVENNMEVSQKIKSRATVWSSKSTSWCLFKGIKIIILKSYVYSQVHYNIN